MAACTWLISVCRPFLLRDIPTSVGCGGGGIARRAPQRWAVAAGCTETAWRRRGCSALPSGGDVIVAVNDAKVANTMDLIYFESEAAQGYGRS